MSYSGLIYAAIVACWAAVLVPKWIRRNEEVERAREEDAARGVRVLERRQSHVPHGSVRPVPAGAGELGESDETREGAGEDLEGYEIPLPSFGAAARRRRRVLSLLTLLLGVVVLGAAAGRLPPGTLAVPVALLGGFAVLARRATVAEARRRARIRRSIALRRVEEQAREAAPAVAPSGKRLAVLDLPEPAEPPDPNAWDPVPVPLPTYLTKAKAETPAARRIDLSSPGAWTSGRLNPAGSISLPLPPHEEADRSPVGPAANQQGEWPDDEQQRWAVGG